MLAVRQGSMGYIRYILKDGLKYFPLYGLYFRQVCNQTFLSTYFRAILLILACVENGGFLLQFQHSCIYVKRGNFQCDKTSRHLDEFAASDIPVTASTLFSSPLLRFASVIFCSLRTLC